MRLYSPETFRRVEIEDDEKAVSAALRSGLVPSVTEILSIVNEGPHLTNWFIKKSIEHYIEHQDIKEAVKFRDDTSAEFGTVCHDLAEAYLNGQHCKIEFDERHLAAVEPFKKWVDENVDRPVFTEEFFADGKRGYGGTADMLLLLKNGELLLGDLKVKKDSWKFPMKPSQKYKYQLSSYRNHFRDTYGEMKIANFLLASPFNNTKKPTEAKLKVFNYGYEDWTTGFEAARLLWMEKYGG